MNERQRDLFLYLWSRRRTPGIEAIALRGALIGAAGGILFAVIMLGQMSFTGDNAFSALLERGGALLGLSIPAFAFIGWIGARRVYASQEMMYQAMLQSGARVPEQKPVMQPGDRGPAIAVGIAVAVIAGFILVLFVMYG